MTARPSSCHTASGWRSWARCCSASSSPRWTRRSSALAVAFVWAESRADEPIVPLGLFRNRTFTASVTAMFLAAMGFFAAIVFLPRWFQVVAGSSATESGYQILPLLGGLIISAIAAGQLVARTGRYKALIASALILLALGLLLLTNIRPDTPRPLIWLWMAIAGLGIGPSFAVFTLAVQNAVPIRQLGTATASLTMFQQVGGTMGLAITGTLFASTLVEEIPNQMVRAGVPAQFADQFASGDSSSFNDLTSVGDLGTTILSQVPEAFRAQVEPMIPAIASGIHTAFSIATGATFLVGIITALLAALVVLVIMPAGKVGEPVEAVTGTEPGATPEAIAD
ncbi:MAG: MFS transporter [Candidatus Limnocylindria bacterium]